MAYDEKPFHEDKHFEGRKRGAFELRIPGRPGRPDRFVSYGDMSTPLQNNAAQDLATRHPAVTVYLGPILGEFRVRPKRRRGPTGRGAPQPVNVNGLPVVNTDTPDVDDVEWARVDVLRSLETGDWLGIDPTLRVARSSTGSLMTVPYKGPVTRWASLDDLVLALAMGRVRR